MPTSRPMVMSYGGSHHYTMAATGKRKTGGRRPKEEEEELGPDEMEKRRLRRLRNKEAAARCRQRRLNHMQTLQERVDQLVSENKVKQREIDDLIDEKAQLLHVLQNHSCNMKNGAVMKKPSFIPPTIHHGSKSATPELQNHHQHVKMEPHEDPTLTQVVTIGGSDGFNTTTSMSLSRPSSLPFDTPSSPGVPIQTPTAGFGGFDLLGQSTGLTPVTNTGLTPILTMGGAVTCGALTLETPTLMDTCPPLPVKIATTLHNL